MNRAIVAGLALIIALLVIAAWAQAPTPPPQQGPPPGMGMPGMPGMPGMGGPGGFRPMMACPASALMPPPVMMIEMASERLQLTNEQVNKLKTLLGNADQTLRPLRDKSREATEALRGAVFAPDKDAKALQELAGNAEKAEAAVTSAEVDIWTQVKSILKPEQLKMMQEMMGRGPGRQMPMMPPPGGPQPPAGPPPPTAK